MTKPLHAARTWLRELGPYRAGRLARNAACAALALLPLALWLAVFLVDLADGVTQLSEWIFVSVVGAAAAAGILLSFVPWPRVEIDPRRGATRFRVGLAVPPFVWFVAGAFTLAALLDPVANVFGWLLRLGGLDSSAREEVLLAVLGTSFAAALAALPFLLRPAELEVSPRGLSLRTGIRTRRARHARALDIVRPALDRVEVRLEGGRILRVPMRWLAPEEREMLEDRLREEAARAASVGARDGLLDRKGRAFSAWGAAVRAIASHEPGYRGPSLSREELLAIASDPLKPAERRIGAALALGAAGVPAEEVDLSAPERRVRVALEAALEGELEEAELEAALDEERLAEVAFGRGKGRSG